MAQIPPPPAPLLPTSSKIPIARPTAATKHLITSAWAESYFKHKPSDLSKINKLFIQNLVTKHQISESSFLNGLKPHGNYGEWIKYFSNWYWEIEEDVVREFGVGSFNGIEKSDQIAQYFRETGNDYYKSSNLQNALRAYNLAIVFSQPNGSELSLAYGNRSALFYQFGEYKKSLDDIYLAKKSKFPPAQMPKLNERIKKCFKALNLGVEVLGDILENEDSTTLKGFLDQQHLQDSWTSSGSGLVTEQVNYGKTQLFHLQAPNGSIPTAENFVEIVVNEERGRHVVVTKDVKPGTVLIVDQPFAKILLNDWKFDLNHCHYCHKEMNSGIPCPGCVFAFFCNENCYQASIQSFHQYECKCSPLLYGLQAPRTLLLALRIICTLGPQEAYQIYSTKDPEFLNPDTTDRILGFNDAKIYDSSSYLPIYHLISHPSQSNRHEIWSYVLSALALVSGLKKFTLFFDGFCQDQEFPEFIASLILLHMLNLPCNAHSLNELGNFKDILKCQENELEKRESLIKTSVCQEYGAGAFGLLSLINHSCDPNVFRVNLHSGQVAVLTLRGLKSGEELLDNYGVHFALMDSTSRKAHLMENYGFNCECSACHLNWPLLPELKDLNETFICSHCSVQTTTSQKLNPVFIKHCALSPSKLICTQCNQKYDYKTLIDNLDCKIDLFFYAHDLVLQNEPITAMPLLVDCLEYFDSAVLSPFIRLNDTQETIKQAVNLIAASTSSSL